MSRLQALTHNEFEDSQSRTFQMLLSWYRAIPRKYAELHGDTSAEEVLKRFEAEHRRMEEVLDDDDISLTELLAFCAMFSRRVDARHVAIE